ncbi:MAG: hypothetical protein WCK11_01060 [Candidatus Falkowbacteria bacterium]
MNVELNRIELIDSLSQRILAISKSSAVLVGIDGASTAGKTTMAAELESKLKESGRNVIKVTIDGFNNPRSTRYAKGANSPEGFYKDSYNNEIIINELLKPLSEGKLEYKPAHFSVDNDTELNLPTEIATKDSIILIEGIFLFRPELVKYFDYKIFIEIDLEESKKRAINRPVGKHRIGSEEEITKRYDNRYIPGQIMYYEEAKPHDVADVIIDNNNIEKPILKTNKI